MPPHPARLGKIGRPHSRKVPRPLTPPTVAVPLARLRHRQRYVFMNETVRDYCAAEKIEFTRCRPYRKNDQAHVEQKNGDIVRRMVGYRRYEGIAAAEQLAKLYSSARLFVNAFQACFKLAEKTR